MPSCLFLDQIWSTSFYLSISFGTSMQWHNYVRATPMKGSHRSLNAMECRICLLLKLLMSMSAYRLVKEAVFVDLPQMHTDLSKRLLTRSTIYRPQPPLPFPLPLKGLPPPQ
jgi:hypothetical protein